MKIMGSDPNLKRGSDPRFLGLVAGFLLLSVLVQADPMVRVVDSMGREVVLNAPARRVVALAPHIVENLFAAGAGDRVVGAVSFSNFPPAAKRIPRVGSFSNFSVESIAALDPDLVIGWSSGHKAFAAVQAQLESLGIPVYVDEPRQLEEVAHSLRAYGALTGRGESAEQAAQQFEAAIDALRMTYRDAETVSVFYQVWHRPLQTLNGEHIVSDLMRLCGGYNAFGDAAVLAPRINIEAVVARDPQVIIASGMAQSRPEWLDDWRRWPDLTAVRHGNLYFIHPDWLQRHTPRLVQGAAEMCVQLRSARQNLGLIE